MNAWPKRYMLEAWVCNNVCVHYVASTSWMTFDQIWQARPDDCRYAVLATVKIDNPADNKVDGRFIVVDLFECMTPGIGQITMPEPIGRYDDLDAAVMTTTLFYED